MQESQAQVQSVLLLTDRLANERIKSKDGILGEMRKLQSPQSWLNGWQEGEGGDRHEGISREWRKSVVSSCDRFRQIGWWGRCEITNCRFRSYLLLFLKIEIEGTGGVTSQCTHHTNMVLHRAKYMYCLVSDHSTVIAGKQLPLQLRYPANIVLTTMQYHMTIFGKGAYPSYH